MISTAFVFFAGLVFQIILLPFTLLGDSQGFPESVDTAVASVASYTGVAGNFIPMDSIHTLVMFIITFEITIVWFYLMRWMFGFLPVVGGR